MSKTTSGQGIALYNPLTISLLTLIFTPILGGTLVAKNWDTLNEPFKARQARRWIRTTLFLIVVYIVANVLFANEPLMEFSGVYLLFVMWLGWFLTTGLGQIRFVMGVLNNRYTRLSLSRPLFIGGLGWVLYTMVQISVNMAVQIFDIQPLTQAKVPGVTIKIPEGQTQPVVIPDSTNGKAAPVLEVPQKDAPKAPAQS